MTALGRHGRHLTFSRPWSGMIRIRQMSQPERRMLRCAMTAEPLDLRTGIPEHDEVLNGKNWPRERCIRARVLANLLLRTDGMSQGSIPVLRIAGARITGSLELGSAEIVKSLWLEECYIEETPDLTDARIRSLRILRSYLPGLKATNLKVDGQLDLDKTTVNGRLRLVNAHITGEFTMSGTTLINPKDWTLFAGGLTVDGAFFGRSGFQSKGPIRLVGAHLNGGVFLDGGAIDAGGADALVADNLRVEGRMIIDRLISDGALRLPGARINGQLSLNGATIRTKEKVALDFRRLSAEEVILTPAEPIVGIVDLGNARVSVLYDSPGTWPTEIHLDGFIYDTLLAAKEDNLTNLAQQRYVTTPAGMPTEILPSKYRLAWLDRNEIGYRPQPYEQLSAFYRRMGHDDQARQVLLTKQRRRRATQNLTGKFWSYLLDFSVGYGYRPWLAFIWLTTLVAIGAAVFAWRPPSPIDPGKSLHFNSLVYTINLLLPVGQFVEPNQWSPVGVGRWFAYILVGLGWLLATAVIAGVTRVLNRS
jgi:hypothetical protein